MGKPTGFMDFEREENLSSSVSERIKNYKNTI